MSNALNTLLRDLHRIFDSLLDLNITGGAPESNLLRPLFMQLSELVSLIFLLLLACLSVLIVLLYQIFKIENK